MKVTSGHIPENLTYVLGKKRTIRIEWDDVTREDGETAPQEEVQPIFVCDSTNEKTLGTARSWAGGGAATEVVRKNEPFTGMRVVGLDFRQNGGRAWKCVSPEGYWFDLREDILLDIMRTEGISTGGYLNGQYIWARIGTEMKLIRVDSELHNAVRGANDRRNAKALHKKELKPWHLYQKKNGEVLLYCGKVRGLKLLKENEHSSYRDSYENPELKRLREWSSALQNPGSHYEQHYRRVYGNDMSRPKNPKPLDLKYEPYREDLWIGIDCWVDNKPLSDQVKNVAADLEKVFSNSETHSRWYRANLGGDVKVVFDLGEFQTEGLFLKIRERALESYLRSFVDKTAATRTKTENDYIIIERNRVYNAGSWLPWGTIYGDTEEPASNTDSWRTWMLSMEPVQR